MKTRIDIFRNEYLWVTIVFLLSAYLMFWNLDYVYLWHDEGTNAVTARNLLTTGTFSGWDGRNLFGGNNGLALDINLNIAAYPPLPIIISALGMFFWGDNELGARFFHAFLGAATLPVFWLLLRLDFASRPRLRILAFTLLALSTQFILFARQGRYYADAIFLSLLSFYCYRLYWEHGRRIRHLALTAFVTVLNFLAHYAIGASFALAIAAWHLLYYRRETTAHEWIRFTVAGLIVALLCLFYLWATNVIGGEKQLEHGGHQTPWLERHLFILYYYARDTVYFFWLPLTVVIWLTYKIGTRLLRYDKHNKKKTRQKKHRQKQQPANHDEAALFRWFTLTGLILFMSALVSVQDVARHKITDTRYLVALLPFTALLIAAFVDWLWQQQKPYGTLLAIPAFTALILSNALAYPLIHPAVFTPQERIRWTLPSLLTEIHRPYKTAVQEVVAYLRKHSKQDDTINTEPWQDYVLLMYYLSDRLIFCCSLDGKDGLPRDKIKALGVPLYKGDVQPKWYVTFSAQPPDQNIYELVFTSETFYYSTQRPEIEYRTFAPLRRPPHAHVYRLKQ